MADWRVRAARVDDVDAMVQLQLATWRSDYAEWLGRDFCDARFEEHVRERLHGFVAAHFPFRRTLILERGDEWAGFVAYGAGHGDPGEILSMYVSPQWRGQRGGAFLVHQAWEALAVRGLTPVQIAVLEQNLEAQRFYRRLGACEVARGEFEINGRTFREIVLVLRQAPISEA